MRALLTATSVALIFAGSALAQPLNPVLPALRGGYRFLGGGIVPVGTPTSITFPTTQFTSITDLPNSQFVQGYTADIPFATLTPAGTQAAYAPGTATSPGLAFNVNSLGYKNGLLSSIQRTLFLTSYLRQTYTNDLLPTESANGGNVLTAWAFNDFMYYGDVPSCAVAVANIYNSASTAASCVPVTNNEPSTEVAPLPVGAWITEPGLLLTASAPVTVEFVAGQTYGQGGAPLDTVTISLNDGVNAPISHNATLALSQRLLSTGCTATTGSNLLTGCTSTAGFQVGERLTVPGIPGQPKIMALTSSTMMLGATGTVTLTTASPTITVTNSTVANGDGLADGLFVGSTINCAGVNAGTDATVTAEGTPTIVSNKTTQVTFTINTSVTVAATNQSCTFKHVMQAATGPVRVTLGNPVPTWQATFTAAEQATFNDGNLWFRAQAKPLVGTQVLDSQLGAANATGPNVDWNGKTLAVNGTDVSPNLHNLMAFKDTMAKYGQTWAWVSGTQTAGATPAVQTTATDPGSTAYYANIGAACQALESYNSTHYGHANANGGTIYVHAGTQTTGLGTFSDCTVASGPRLMVANAPADGPLTASISSQGNTIVVSPRITFKGLIFNATATGSVATITGGDGAVTTGGNISTELLFDQDKLATTVANALLSVKVGDANFYNDLIDESLFDGTLLRSNSNTSSAIGMLAGSTVIGGTFNGSTATFSLFNEVGNVTWGLGIQQPPQYGGPGNSAVLAQPLSSFIGFYKHMGGFGVVAFQNGPLNNLYMTSGIIETLNAGSSTPALRISADDIDSPISNVTRVYDAVYGARTNGCCFLEGLPGLGAAGVATGGSLAAGTYMIEPVYANASAPGTEVSTNGPVAITVGGTGAGSITLNNFADPTYVLNFYISAVGGSTPTNIATVTAGTTTGLAGTGIATGQTLTITGIGAAATPTAGLPNKNEVKFPYFQRFTVDTNQTQKNDTYGASGAIANGGRVGNWPSLARAGWLGTVNMTGSFIGTSNPSPTSGLGSVFDPYGVFATSVTNIVALIKPKSNRSWGNNNATLVAPALNIGQGNYCPDTSVTGAKTVPAGFAAWPYDIEGNPRNDIGGGWAGPYEGGCI